MFGSLEGREGKGSGWREIELKRADEMESFLCCDGSINNRMEDKNRYPSLCLVAG